MTHDHVPFEKQQTNKATSSRGRPEKGGWAGGGARADTRNCYRRGRSDREREKEVGRAELSGGEGTHAEGLHV